MHPIHARPADSKRFHDFRPRLEAQIQQFQHQLLIRAAQPLNHALELSLEIHQPVDVPGELVLQIDDLDDGIFHGLRIR